MNENLQPSISFFLHPEVAWLTIAVLQGLQMTLLVGPSAPRTRSKKFLGKGAISISKQQPSQPS
jgi:hypothetical protein